MHFLKIHPNAHWLVSTCADWLFRTRQLWLIHISADGNPHSCSVSSFIMHALQCAVETCGAFGSKSGGTVSEKGGDYVLRLEATTHQQETKLAPWSRLLEKLKGPPVVNKFSVFCGTRRFITASASSRHLSLSWARSTQSMLPSHFLKINFNIILPYKSSISKWSLFLRCPTRTLCAPLLSPYVLHATSISLLSILLSE